MSTGSGDCDGICVICGVAVAFGVGVGVGVVVVFTVPVIESVVEEVES